jgi:hypothetical protein
VARPQVAKPKTSVGKLRLKWVQETFGSISAFCEAAELTMPTARRWVFSEPRRVDMATVRKLRLVSTPQHLILDP